MIQHISLWKFTNPDCTTEYLEEVAREWRALKEKVPSLRDIQVGINIGPSPDNYHIAACIHFDSFDGYKAYVENAEHCKFAEKYLYCNINVLDESRAAIQLMLR